MKANTHGIPNARHIRRKTARERLMAVGWFTTGNGKRWKHRNYPDIEFTTGEAVAFLAAWDAKQKAGSA